ncbi:hypothetical protein BLNAU_7570 [Blattamonas nauphoetae]|uniref:Uncharacterized protein n=1 Tax=Blattamonas nauphoetae TaxID=2049346 RepID=A0ABQ9Y166_9EUKA|nr:hypothetical protein BLNAU_7570 [Blattamonas nauphoetae]
MRFWGYILSGALAFQTMTGVVAGKVLKSTLASQTSFKVEEPEIQQQIDTLTTYFGTLLELFSWIVFLAVNFAIRDYLYMLTLGAFELFLWVGLYFLLKISPPFESTFLSVQYVIAQIFLTVVFILLISRRLYLRYSRRRTAKVTNKPRIVPLTSQTESEVL